MAPSIIRRHASTVPVHVLFIGLLLSASPASSLYHTSSEILHWFSHSAAKHPSVLRYGTHRGLQCSLVSSPMWLCGLCVDLPIESFKLGNYRDCHMFRLYSTRDIGPHASQPAPVEQQLGTKLYCKSTCLHTSAAHVQYKQPFTVIFCAYSTLPCC